MCQATHWKRFCHRKPIRFLAKAIISGLGGKHAWLSLEFAVFFSQGICKGPTKTSKKIDIKSCWGRSKFPKRCNLFELNHWFLQIWKSCHRWKLKEFFSNPYRMQRPGIYPQAKGCTVLTYFSEKGTKTSFKISCLLSSFFHGESEVYPNFLPNFEGYLHTYLHTYPLILNNKTCPNIGPNLLQQPIRGPHPPAWLAPHQA